MDEGKHYLPNTNFVLPEWLYEVMRYLSWIVIPAVMTFLTTLNTALGWGWPMESILSVSVAVETLIGAVLGLSKHNNDANNT